MVLLNYLVHTNFYFKVKSARAKRIRKPQRILEFSVITLADNPIKLEEENSNENESIYNRLTPENNLFDEQDQRAKMYRDNNYLWLLDNQIDHMPAKIKKKVVYNKDL